MKDFRVQLFPKEAMSIMDGVKRVFARKPKLKQDDPLELEIGSRTKYGYSCVDVYWKGKLVGEIRRRGIDELIEKGAFVYAKYHYDEDEIDKITITCLEVHEYENKPEYKAWRSKL